MSWSAIVLTSRVHAALTERLAVGADSPTALKSVKIWQSAWVCGFDPWPLTMAM